jgi:dihydrofolate reductase
MATVITHAVTSLDGYIATENDEVGPLFDWYYNGDVDLYGGQGAWQFRISQTSFDYVDPFWRSCGAVVIGRQLFDLTNGWNGVPSVGDAVFVVTHEAPTDWAPGNGLTADTAPFTFVTTGVADAVAQACEVAGDRAVSVTAGNIGGQVIAAGLADEVAMDVVPVVFGSGKHYFGSVDTQVLLDDPHVVVQGDRVLHLRYRVRR